MKYFGGCDVGSTYTKAVILDENGKMVADTTIKSKINSEQSAIAAMQEVIDQRLAVIDLTASVMCQENHMPLAVFDLNEENSIANAMQGKINGTIVTVD